MFSSDFYRCFFTAIFIFLSFNAFNQDFPQGNWKGELYKNGFPWNVSLYAGMDAGEGKVEISFPDWGMIRLDADSVKWQDDNLYFYLPWLKIPFTAVVKGEVMNLQISGKKEISGKLLQLSEEAYLTKTENIEIKADDGATLSATLLLPDAQPPYAAMVLTHGSGPDTRSTGAYLGKAKLAVEEGMAVLIYDKRGAGESTNPGGAFVTLPRLVKDAQLLIAELKIHAQIDKSRIGIGGISQGGWVAPWVAYDDTSIAFVFTTATPGISPAEQNVYTLQTRLEPEDVHQGKRALRSLYEYYRTGKEEERQEAENLILHSGRNWTENEFFKRLMFTGGEIPDSINPSEWPSMFVDPLIWWREIKVPVAIFSGADDINVPTDISHALIRTAQEVDAGNENLSIYSFPHAGHGLSLENTPEGDWPRAAKGYVFLMRAWFAEQSL